MTTRTIKTTVTFARPFLLAGFDEPLPAGDYRVETDEERVEGVSFPVWRRRSAFLELPGRGGTVQTLTLDPNDLDAALQRDREAADTDNN